MFNPEMMAAAQKMMQNMKPEDMQRMSQMAANMDPTVMENMMKGMGADPAACDAKKAADMMKDMSPEQLRSEMGRAQQQMGAQKQYYYNAADMLKKEGNDLVKSERYAEALTKYERALENCKSCAGDDVTSLRVSLLNNSALCHLRMRKYESAMASCEEGLVADPKNFKALFRRGQCRAELGQLLEAVADVKKALDLSPSDKAIATELEKLRGQLKERGLKEEDCEDTAPTQHKVADVWQAESSAPVEAGRPVAFTPASTAAGSRASSSSAVPSSGGSSASASPASGGDKWSKAAEKLAENPEMLKQATDAMSKMSPEDLEKMMNCAPLPPGMDKGTVKAQMEQLQKNPDMLKNAMESLQSLPEDERKKMLEASSYGKSGGRMPDASAMNGFFDNPEMLQQAVEMTKGMSDDDLKKLNINSHEEADVMRKAAEQMAANPDLAKTMSDMMKNMPPEQMQKMMEMSAQMRGGGGPGGAGGGGLGAGGGLDDPDKQAAMSAMMNDPEMMKATEEMMKNISPEALASMAKASGIDLDEGKAKMLARCLPWLMKGMRVFGYAKKGWSSLWSKKGRYVLAIVILLVALYQHYRSE